MTMANEMTIADADASLAHPIVHTIGTADLRGVLSRGFDDFMAMRSADSRA
jgi:hypothetical protein